MALISVRELLSLPALHGSELIAGTEGLTSHVKSVNIMEVPDIESFVRAGDLLLTTAYPIKDDPERLSSLIATLKAKGLAALGVKPGRYLDEISHALINACDTHGLPLIVLEKNLAFDQVIGQVMAIVLSDVGAEPKRAAAIRQRLTASALGGGGLSDITHVLSESIAREVEIISPHEFEDDGAGFEIFPITVAGSLETALKMPSDPPLTLGQRQLVQHACFAAGLHLAQTRAASTLHDRLKALALEELVHAEVPAAEKNAALFNWDIRPLNQVIVARTAHPIVINDEEYISFWGGEALGWTRDTQVTVICRQERAISNKLEAWRARLIELTLQEHQALTQITAEDATTTGVLGSNDHAISTQTTACAGARVTTYKDLKQAYATAKRTLLVAEQLGIKTACFEEFEMEFLLQALDRELLEYFMRRNIGAIIDYDEEHSSELIETLFQVLGTGNNTKAAKNLFIHYNTLKYRMEQIKELIGEDWENPRTRMRLLLALQIYLLEFESGASKAH